MVMLRNLDVFHVFPRVVVRASDIARNVLYLSCFSPAFLYPVNIYFIF